MAIYYVDAQSVGADLGTKADPFKTFLQGMNAAGNGDSIYVSHTSNEIVSNPVYNCKGQVAISVDFADDSYRAGALIATGGIADIIWLASGNGFIDSYGINYSVTDDFRSQGHVLSFNDCDISITGTTDRLDLLVGLTRLNNVDVIFGDAGARIEYSTGSLLWRGGALVGAGDNLLVEFGAVLGEVVMEGVDLSSIENLVSIKLGGVLASRAIFKGCLLKLGFTLFAGTLSGSQLIALYGSHSSNIPYFVQEAHSQGSIITETTNVKTGGSSDGTIPISMKFVTSADVSRYTNPLRMALPVKFYASTIGLQTFDVDILTDGLTLQDDEAWLELSHPDATIQRAIADTLPVNPLSIPADLPLSAATWDTTGITTPVKQRISITVDIKQVGWVEAHICFARPSEVMHADLKLLDGQRQWLAGQAYINGEAIPPPEPPLPVINGYIMPMIAELVREQIALIILTELPNQKAIAEQLSVDEPLTTQGIQAIKDLEDGIYDIIDHIFIEKGTHFQAAQMPGINIYYGRSDFSATEGDNITQVSNSNYSIGVHVTKAHLKKGDNLIEDGDKLSAYMTARVLGILRAILQSGQYVTLGNTFKGIIYGRRVSGLDVFLPDAQESDGRHGIVGILNISVKFKELSPEAEGELLASASTAITAKLRTADDGKVILIENEEV